MNFVPGPDANGAEVAFEIDFARLAGREGRPELMRHARPRLLAGRVRRVAEFARCAHVLRRSEAADLREYFIAICAGRHLKVDVRIAQGALETDARERTLVVAVDVGCDPNRSTVPSP